MLVRFKQVFTPILRAPHTLRLPLTNASFFRSTTETVRAAVTWRTCGAPFCASTPSTTPSASRTCSRWTRRGAIRASSSCPRPRADTSASARASTLGEGGTLDAARHGVAWLQRLLHGEHPSDRAPVVLVYCKKIEYTAAVR